MRENFNIKKENITIFCDIHSDVKNRIEKIYKYIIKIDKPYKLVIQFYDEEKVEDNKLYETEEEQKNKITELISGNISYLYCNSIISLILIQR